MSLSKRIIRENLKKAGDTGVQGPQGPAGEDGASWLTGPEAPSVLVGKVGDLWLDSTSGEFYLKTSSAVWTLRGSIRGPQGEEGPGFYNVDGGTPFSVYGGTEALDGGGV